MRRAAIQRLRPLRARGPAELDPFERGPAERCPGLLGAAARGPGLPESDDEGRALRDPEGRGPARADCEAPPSRCDFPTDPAGPADPPGLPARLGLWDQSGRWGLSDLSNDSDRSDRPDLSDLSDLSNLSDLSDRSGLSGLSGFADRFGLAKPDGPADRGGRPFRDDPAARLEPPTREVDLAATLAPDPVFERAPALRTGLAARVRPTAACFLGTNSLDCGAAGSGRQRTSSLPMIWTGAQPRAVHSPDCIDVRACLSSPATLTLIKPCADSARSVSAMTAAVRPESPIITTGSRWWAWARRAFLCAELSSGIVTAGRSSGPEPAACILEGEFMNSPAIMTVRILLAP